MILIQNGRTLLNSDLFSIIHLLVANLDLLSLRSSIGDMLDFHCYLNLFHLANDLLRFWLNWLNFRSTEAASRNNLHDDVPFEQFSTFVSVYKHFFCLGDFIRVLHVVVIERVHVHNRFVGGSPRSDAPIAVAAVNAVRRR